NPIPTSNACSRSSQLKALPRRWRRATSSNTKCPTCTAGPGPSSGRSTRKKVCRSRNRKRIFSASSKRTRARQMRPANFSLLAVLILTSLARAAPAPETVDTAAEASVDAAAERAAALADRQAWEQIILELEAREGIYAVELSEAY